jgi:hypothetical protein
MRQVKVTIENIPGSPYSQSAKHYAAFLEREDHESYDRRTWKEKCTVTPEGQVCIPAMSLKQAIDTAAQKVGMKVPGRRGAGYKGFFTSGFICDHNVPIANGKAIMKDDAQSVTIYANLDGRRGGSKRGPRTFPQFDKWHGVAEFTIIDDIITPEVFEHHVKAAGMIVGIGRFRPENGGTNGRFRATKFEWQEFNI